jgi:hypothetical protein
MRKPSLLFLWFALVLSSEGSWAVAPEAQSTARATGESPKTSQLLARSVGFVSKADLLQTHIWSDKPEYLLAEPIVLRYRMKNVGDEVIWVNLGEIGCYLDLQDKHGHAFPKKKSYAIPSVYSFSYPDSLIPGEEAEGWVNLQDIYGTISAGEYTCFLHNPHGRVQKALILPSKRTSDTTEIAVKNPAGEERCALDVFLEAVRLSSPADNEDTSSWAVSELSFSKYQELVNSYPNSVYAPLSLRAAIGAYAGSHLITQRRKVILLCIRLIEDYPDSHDWAQTFTDLVNIYRILKDKDGAINTMQELIEKHPGTKISERAEYWLGKIQDWKFE